MSEIIKTPVIVLRKNDYGDTSKIVTLFSAEYGKFSGIVKAGRSNKSKIGGIIDVFNYIEIVYYKKESRSIQLLTQADLINFYGNIKKDIIKYKYASAILEVVYELTHENESNPLLFKGLIRIFDLLETGETVPKLLFIKFMLFFIKELGYEININNCTICENKIHEDGYLDMYHGTLCNSCYTNNEIPTNISKELFKNIKCLTNRNNDISIDDNNLEYLLTFLQRYLKRNIPEFSGIKSLNIY